MTEPEEVIEAKLAEVLTAALPDIPVVGALSPVLPGGAKESADTSVSVYVDLASQDMDWRGGRVPCTFAARVVVHTAFADDRSGAKFRDTCRAVRAALLPFLGDGCGGFDGSGFACDAFRIDSTETGSDTSEFAEGLSKTYNLTLAGRFSRVD